MALGKVEPFFNLAKVLKFPVNTLEWKFWMCPTVMPEM
jgi:hypothetical protein